MADCPMIYTGREGHTAMTRTLAQTFRFDFDDGGGEVRVTLELPGEMRLESIPLTPPEAARIGSLIEQAVEIVCEAEARRRLSRPS